jgi:hypothetical protein
MTDVVVIVAFRMLQEQSAKPLNMYAIDFRKFLFSKIIFMADILFRPFDYSQATIQPSPRSRLFLVPIEKRIQHQGTSKAFTGIRCC